jgi:predicted secreted acid phosphatase
LLVGDNYGDFSVESRGTVEERDVSAENYAAFWGHKWIMIPNPLYGSWEGALINNNFGASMSEKLSTKRARLQAHR